MPCDTPRSDSYGHHLYRHRDCFIRGNTRVGIGDRSTGKRVMRALYFFNGLLALLLFGYLFWALLKAERF